MDKNIAAWLFEGEEAGEGRVDYYNVGDGIPASVDVSFPVNIKLYYCDPCKGKQIMVDIDNCGGVEFSVTFPPEAGSFYSEFDGEHLHESFKNRFGIMNEGFYTFVLPFKNMQKTCVEETVKGSFGQGPFSVINEITFIFDHAPKDDVFMR